MSIFGDSVQAADSLCSVFFTIVCYIDTNSWLTIIFRYRLRAVSFANYNFCNLAILAKQLVLQNVNKLSIRVTTNRYHGNPTLPPHWHILQSSQEHTSDSSAQLLYWRDVSCWTPSLSGVGLWPSFPSWGELSHPDWLERTGQSAHYTMIGKLGIVHSDSLWCGASRIGKSRSGDQVRNTRGKQHFETYKQLCRNC